MKAMKPCVLVLFGPTASGKTALALAWAEQVGGEIVNADSRQVYARMPILTACPTAEDYARVPHHLFEYVQPDVRINAGLWAEQARAVVEDILARGKWPIVVGGTGFYLRALLEGMDAVPEIPVEVEDEFEEMEPDERFALLQQVDPVLGNKLHIRDAQRVVRALSVWRHTGVPLGQWQGQQTMGKPDWDVVRVGLNPPRELMRERIATRWKMMLEAGVVEEVKALRMAGFEVGMPGMNGLGVREIFAYVGGAMPLAAVGRAIVDGTRQYAKRQVTWLRNSFAADVVVESGADGVAWLEKLVNKA